MNDKKNIVLLGAGHANSQVLLFLKKVPKSLANQIQIIVINDGDTSFYSGMLPGSVAGQYTEPELTIYLEPLAKTVPATLINSRALEIDGDSQTILLENSEQVHYDYLLINIGSRNLGSEVRGVYEYSLPTRPLKELLRRIEEKENSLRGTSPSIAVVGGGAAGIELAFALSRRFENPHITLISSKILNNTPEKIKQTVIKELENHRINLIIGQRVLELRENTVQLDNNTEINADLIIWATGAAPIDVNTNLPKCPNGYFLVNRHLQSVGHRNVLGAGDCITFEDMPLGFPAKAGVYSVREGPFLFQNLLSLLKEDVLGKNSQLKVYTPQIKYLAILNMCNGKAIAFKGNTVFKGRAMWWLKNRLDKSFMNRFRVKGFRYS